VLEHKARAKKKFRFKKQGGERGLHQHQPAGSSVRVDGRPTPEFVEKVQQEYNSVFYSKDDLAHVIYPGGVSKDDWVYDLPRLINETWTRRGE
jgi:hypothetical protein